MSRATPFDAGALEAATLAGARGDTRALYDLLTRGSRLPSPRPNEALADAFAEGCRSRGAAVDRLVVQMATLDADRAPGATPLEFLPMCGVFAAAARAKSDDRAYGPMLQVLHQAADDLRFRVRDAVIVGLSRIGAVRGADLLLKVAEWMDGFFHAAAVLSAIAQDAWIDALHDPAPVVLRLDEAFALARDASRSDFRYPGHKALVDALGVAPAACAARFGVPVFDMLERWSAVKEPVLREAVMKSVSAGRLGGRFAAEVKRVKRALEATEPAPRDPRFNVGPTRNRSKGRRAKG